MASITPAQLEELETLCAQVVKLFQDGDWTFLAAVTDTNDLVNNHHRLLRSKRFGDPDYPDNALDVLIKIATRDKVNIDHIRGRVKKLQGADAVNVSSAPLSGAPTVVFSPTVFNVPASEPDHHLLSVMMPFDASMTAVYDSIKSEACKKWLTCKRGDDIWNTSVVVQDIFSLIYSSYVVVCDFTGRNPNVFYEAGIAHTLGKHVIPITQNSDDVPFNLRHHRFIEHLNNNEGRDALAMKLGVRIDTLLDDRHLQL